MNLLTKKYLRFDEIPNPGKKTQIFTVRHTDNLTLLGEIKWWGAWRKYCFFPAPDCLYDRNCLRDVIDYIDQLMNERKENKF